MVERRAIRRPDEHTLRCEQMMVARAAAPPCRLPTTAPRVDSESDVVLSVIG